MSNHQEISSFIWRVCDDELRGLFKPHEYGDIILPFVVLRRLDCLIEPHKDEVVNQYEELIKSGINDPTPIIKKKTGLNFFNYSPYDLSRLKSDPNGLKINFPNYVNGYSDNVHQILENFQLEKPVEKLIKNKKLYSLIDKFTEVDLHPNKIDNHTMGSIFEELLRKFSEMSNETSGEHYTPRDVVKLLVSLVFNEDEDNLKGEGIIRSIYDPCCGTGGMLTIGKEWVNENISSDVMFQLYGQELNPQTFSICKSDFLITGEDPERIKLGTSLSNDQHEGRTFDYMITNPPFGVSWKSEKSFIDEESKNPLGRFSNGLPWIKDGQLLFMSHMISKMNPNGSRIGIVSNGSPLTTGDGNRGESQFRKWLVDQDLLESITLLPDDLFFNTGILSYIWVLNNKKPDDRKGKIQIINGLNKYEDLFKPIGDKRKVITRENLNDILSLNKKNQINEDSLIFDSNDFKYNYIKVYHPLRDQNGELVKDKKGKIKKDSNLTEKIKLDFNQNIKEFETKYLKSFPNSWIDHNEIIVGCEFHITKYFFKPRSIKSFSQNLEEINIQKSKIDLVLNNLVKPKNKKSENKSQHWFGDIPEKWDVLPIGDCFIERKTKVSDKDYEPLSVTMGGVVPQLESSVKTSDGDKRKLVKKNDFVINGRSDRRGSSGISQLDGSVSNIYHVLEPKHFLLPMYVHFLFRSLEFQEEFYRNGKGIVDDLWTTDYNEMRKILIPVPNIEIQESIVNKTKKIKDLVVSFEKLNDMKKELVPSYFSNLLEGYE